MDIYRNGKYNKNINNKELYEKSVPSILHGPPLKQDGEKKKEKKKGKGKENIIDILKQKL